MSPSRIIPLFVFAVIAVASAYYLFFGKPREIPSPLIDKPVPQFVLPPMDGREHGLASDDLRNGDVTLVNIWASWCGPCRIEHPQLMALAERPDIRMVGINYKDDPGNAARFLDRLGDPYERVGVDDTGRVSIDWGVYGVPETFVVNGEGEIIAKHVGPVMPRDIARKIGPAIEKARQ